MMKKVTALLIVLCMVFAVCACALFHKHTWKDATCTEPKTCTGCGETEGEALGHTWVDATCTEPKTCSVCGATEGEALGHAWIDATCTEPKTCSVCGATEGEALGHTWTDATCTEPKTCSVCGVTDGEALGHIWVDATCTEPKTCSVCGVTEGEALGHTWADATCTEPKTCSVCGATEGEALGHTWVDATCTEPKTCSVCGATEGEALGHQWRDATYFEPATCTVCGETNGQKKPSFFASNRAHVAQKFNGISIKAVAVDDEANPTKIDFPEVKIIVKNNTVSPSTARPGYSVYEIEYELHCVAPAYSQGFTTDLGTLCDYYTGYVFEDRTVYGSDTADLNTSVTLDGVEYPIFCARTVDWVPWVWSEEDQGPVSTVTVSYQIEAPAEYDGLVLFFEDLTEWGSYEEDASINAYYLSRNTLKNRYFFHIG